MSESGGQSLAQAAVRFILTSPDVSTVLGGFSDAEQLEEIVAASEAGPLSADLLDEIGAAWRSEAFRKDAPT